jgi:hypothetical protein
VKVRLKAVQRQSCMISSFFLRKPRRFKDARAAVRTGLGLLGSIGTRAMWGTGDILLIVCFHRVMQCTEIEKRRHRLWMGRTKEFWRSRECAEAPLSGFAAGGQKLS